MKNICLIGCGNVGKRHLQAILKIDNINIDVVEPNNDSIKSSMELLPTFDNYFSNIEDVTNNIDVCIIATKSDIRKKIILELIEKKNVKNIILEKIAFQSINDFNEIINLFKSKNIKCWINCHLRTEPVWNRVKEIINNRKINMIYEISKGDGLISTGIHVLDLFCYLTSSSSCNLDFKHISDTILDSKHGGFIELDGDLIAKSNKNTLLIKRRDNKIYHNCTIDIEGNMLSIKHTSKNGDGSWEDPICIIENVNNETFPFLWQSELTNLYVQDILDNNHCNLPSLNDSFNIHKELINNINNVYNKNIEKCPIT